MCLWRRVHVGGPGDHIRRLFLLIVTFMQKRSRRKLCLKAVWNKLEAGGVIITAAAECEYELFFLTPGLPIETVAGPF